MAERSKARGCGRSPAEIAGSNPAGGMDVCAVCVVQYGQEAQAGHRISTENPPPKKTAGGMDVCLL